MATPPRQCLGKSRRLRTPELAIEARFASDLPAALALSAVLVAVSAALLLTIKLLGLAPVRGA